MKRNIALILIIAAIMSVFSSCSEKSFDGGKDYFLDNGTVLTTVVETFLDCFADCDISQSFFNNSNTSNISFSSNVKKFALSGKEIAKPYGALNLSLTFDKLSNFSLVADSDLFGQNFSTRILNKNSEMYIDLGIPQTEILYYAPEKEETYNVIEEIYSYFREKMKEEHFSSKHEDMDSITYSIGSNDLSVMLYFLADVFEDNENRFYNYLADEIKTYANKVRSSKIDLEWTKYYSNSKVEREKITLTNPKNNLVSIDMNAYQKNSMKVVDVSVDGSDSTGDFVLGGLAIEKDDSSSKIKIRLNDKVMSFDLVKKGENTREGSLTVGYIDEDKNYKEAQVGIKAENIKTDDLSYGTKIVLNSISPDVDVDAEFVLTTSSKPDLSIELPEMDKYSAKTLKSDYHVTTLMYFGAGTLKDKINNIIAVFDGQELAYDQIDLTPYQFDEVFSDEEIETEGKYGKELVNLLMSDKYSYCFDYISNASEEHYTEISKTYFENGKRYFYTKYNDGTENREYVLNNVKYVVKEKDKKLVATTYSETEVNRYYPRTIYYYANSGKSTHNGKEYIYENYYDRSGNQYHMMFLDGKLELMWIKDITTKEVLYTMNIEISENIPEGALELPKGYEIVGVLDYYE